MTRHDMILKWVAYGLALLAITILNYYVLGPLPIALPLLLPMAAVAVGTLEGSRFGAGFGLAAGLVMSAVEHSSLFLIPLLSAIGFLCGLLTQYVLRRDLVGHLPCAVIVMLLWEVCQGGYHLLHHTAPLAQLIRVALPEMLWTLLFSLPVYWIARFCCLHYGRIYHE